MDGTTWAALRAFGLTQDVETHLHNLAPVERAKHCLRQADMPQHLRCPAVSN